MRRQRQCGYFLGGSDNVTCLPNASSPLSGDATEGLFRKIVVWIIVSRLAGTIAAQFMLVSAAKLIAFAARAL
jgi:hypothetical protein